MSDTSSVTWTSSLNRYLRAETVGGSLLLVAAAIALIWINSPFGDSYTALRDFEIGPEFLHLHLSLGTWAKDGLLAVFFFVAGLELKRELVIGELADRRKAILPVIAACGGVLLPASSRPPWAGEPPAWTGAGRSRSRPTSPSLSACSHSPVRASPPAPGSSC